MFKRGNLQLRSEAMPTFESGRTLEQDESEIQQQQTDQGLGVNRLINLNPIHPKFMKQVSQKSFSHSPSMKKYTFNADLLNVGSPKGDLFGASPKVSKSNFGHSPSEIDRDKDSDSGSQVNSPHFGRFAMKLAQLNKQQTPNAQSPEKNSSILLDISPKNLMPSKDIKSTKAFGSSFGGQTLKGLSRSKTNSKFIKNGITQQASTKVIDLIHDKAFGAYENEVKEETRKKAIRLKTRNFGKMLQKHIVKGSGPKIFSILNRVKEEGKSRREKIADWIKKVSKLCQKTSREAVECIKKLVEPFNPDGTITLIWEFVLMLLLGLDLILIPFTLAFEDEIQLHRGSLDGFEAWQMVFYVIDMLVNMHTSYYDDGSLVLSHKKIVKKYLRKFVWIDLLSSYPYRWIENGAGIRDESINPNEPESIYQVFAPLKLLRLLRIMRFVRILKFQRIKRYLEQSEYFGPVIVSILSLFQLSLFISLLAHWCACLWFIIGTTNPRYTWLEKAELPQEVDEQYIAALYFTLTTMLTVGYGDIGPVNLRERVFAIFMMLMGGGVFGYTMNSIALILQSLEGEKSKKKKKIKAMMNYLERKKLNNDIKDRIMKYMKFKLENEEGNRSEDHHLMSMLSANLREEVSRQLNGRFINENIVFQSILTKKLKDVLHLYLDEKIFAPHESIYNKEDPDFSLFFVSKGKVELHYDRFKRPLGSIEKGSYFGQIAFFSGDAPTFMARSVEFSHLVYISRTKILQVLEKFPTDKETFAMTRDKIKLYHNYVDLQLKCKICDEATHITTQCPKTHSIFNQEDTIKACLWERKNFQRNFERRKKKPFNALWYMQILTKKAHIFQDEYGYRKRSYSNEFVSADFDMFTKKNDKRFLSPESSQPKTKAKTTIFLNSRKSIFEHQESAVPDEQIPTISHVGTVIPTRRENRLPTLTVGHATLLTVADPQQAQTQTQEKLQKPHKEEVPIDRVKNYEVYFPYNNITKILETMNRKKKKLNTEIFLSPFHKREKLTTKLANAFAARKHRKAPRANSFSVSPFNGKVLNLAPVTQMPLLSLFSNPGEK